MRRSIGCAATLLVLIIANIAIAGEATTQRSPLPAEVSAVRSSARLYDLRRTRHVMLVSAIADDRRERAVGLLDGVIAKQLKLIDAAGLKPSDSDRLATEAKANAALVEVQLALLLKDSDGPDLTAAQRLATIEERIFSIDPEFFAGRPDRLIELMEKSNLTADQKSEALSLRSECLQTCQDIEDESWNYIPRQKRGAIDRVVLPGNTPQLEKFAAGATAAEKFRKLLTPTQLKAWSDELSGAKTIKQ